jgi:hypothetical protein
MAKLSYLAYLVHWDVMTFFIVTRSYASENSDWFQVRDGVISQ